MECVKTIDEMRRLRRKWGKENKIVCLVPTMGYFHDGHLALMDKASEVADRVVVSLFVNPTQFGPGEDYEKYPRDLDRDLELAKGHGVHAVFIPPVDQIYPEPQLTWVEVEQLTEGLCGASRPGHFRGVATVVLKFFNIVTPEKAIFGKKDFQQLQVIKKMVRDLDVPVEIVELETVREPDGLAMSSRNAYLNKRQRRDALCLFKSLELAEGLVRRGTRDTEVILGKITELIEEIPEARIDYIFMGDPNTLRPVKRIDAPTILALAVWIGETRLIDNRLIDF